MQNKEITHVKDSCHISSPKTEVKVSFEQLPLQRSFPLTKMSTQAAISHPVKNISCNEPLSKCLIFIKVSF